MQTYILKNGQQQGPYTDADLDKLLQEGGITGDDLFWQDGADEWKPLSCFPGFVAAPATANSSPVDSDSASQASTPGRVVKEGQTDAIPIPGDEPIRGIGNEWSIRLLRSSVEGNAFPACGTLLGVGCLLMFLSVWPVLLYLPFLAGALGLIFVLFKQNRRNVAISLLVTLAIVPAVIWAMWIKPHDLYAQADRRDARANQLEAGFHEKQPQQPENLNPPPERSQAIGGSTVSQNILAQVENPATPGTGETNSHAEPAGSATPALTAPSSQLSTAQPVSHIEVPNNTYNVSLGNLPFDANPDIIISSLKRDAGEVRYIVTTGLCPGFGWQNYSEIESPFSEGLYSYEGLPPENRSGIAFHPARVTMVMAVAQQKDESTEPIYSWPINRLYYFYTASDAASFRLFGISDTYMDNISDGDKFRSNFSLLRDGLSARLGGKPVILQSAPESSEAEETSAVMWNLPLYRVWLIWRKQSTQAPGRDFCNNIWTVSCFNKAGLNSYLATVKSAKPPTQTDFDRLGATLLANTNGKSVEEVMGMIEQARGQAVPEQAGGTVDSSSGSNNIAEQEQLGPPAKIILSGARIFNCPLQNQHYRRGQTLSSQGIAGTPVGTPIYPVKFDGLQIPVYFIQDEFGDWKVFADGMDSPIPCKSSTEATAANAGKTPQNQQAGPDRSSPLTPPNQGGLQPSSGLQPSGGL